MSNVKYKEAESPDWFYKIFLDGNEEEISKQSFNSKKRLGLNKEMQEWVEDGNTIEQQSTAEELAQKESDDLQNALNSQKSQCIQLLNSSEIPTSNDPPYPTDVEKWKTFRGKIRVILKSNIIKVFPDKPF